MIRPRLRAVIGRHLTTLHRKDVVTGSDANPHSETALPTPSHHRSEDESDARFQHRIERLFPGLADGLLCPTCGSRPARGSRHCAMCATRGTP